LFVLVDSGTGGSSAVRDSLAADGIDPASLHALLLTHGHLDHAGGAAALHRDIGVPVWCSPETAAAIEAGDEEAMSLAAAKRAGVYKDDVRFQACPVARQLDDGETIPLGDSSLRVIRTPGHSHDMLTFLFETPDGLLAFPGDTVFHNGRVLMSATWDCQPLAYAASIRKLASLDIDGLYPGHSIWSVRNGAEQVRLCLPFLDRLLMPPNLL
jgi:glyoxylase-like metal-dependent hydrolase (beta-lactamase superfamily II)